MAQSQACIRIYVTISVISLYWGHELQLSYAMCGESYNGVRETFQSIDKRERALQRLLQVIRSIGYPNPGVMLKLMLPVNIGQRHRLGLRVAVILYDWIITGQCSFQKG